MLSKRLEELKKLSDEIEPTIIPPLDDIDLNPVYYNFDKGIEMRP